MKKAYRPLKISLNPYSPISNKNIKYKKNKKSELFHCLEYPLFKIFNLPLSKLHSFNIHLYTSRRLRVLIFKNRIHLNVNPSRNDKSKTIGSNSSVGLFESVINEWSYRNCSCNNKLRAHLGVYQCKTCQKCQCGQRYFSEGLRLAFCWRRFLNSEAINYRAWIENFRSKSTLTFREHLNF